MWLSNQDFASFLMKRKNFFPTCHYCASVSRALSGGCWPCFWAAGWTWSATRCSAAPVVTWVVNSPPERPECSPECLPVQSCWPFQCTWWECYSFNTTHHIMESAPVLWYLTIRNDCTCLNLHQRMTRACLASHTAAQTSPCLSPRCPCIYPSSSCTRLSEW